MLELKNITKTYEVGEDSVCALDGVSISFRRNEFVSILGPSGCGKTTLLNIIGGLDHYTDGDLLIGDKSTKDFSDSDLDTYRNHSIGFVFQSYNLIPHQSVLANVELALTLSGVSRSERRRRAEDALRRVGLESQMKKKPAQMSGGQMQRVAIARALVNDPEILLADEPTGALDSETSVQIMDLLREVAKDRLVIMVTHNPELAEKYSTRIIKLLDGKVISDSNPFVPEETSAQKQEGQRTKKKEKHTSMSFFTALSLSFNNLMTKKARTFLTSFAGSIGIIGIALILSVSTGVNAYINQVQSDALSSYPLTINAESDMVSLLGNFMNRQVEASTAELEDGYVYSRDVLYDMMTSMSQKETNNLKDFKKYLDNSEEFASLATNIRYGYDIAPTAYTKDPNGKIIPSDMNGLMEYIYSDMGVEEGSASMYSSAFNSMASFSVWQELLSGEDGALVSEAITEQYEIVHGSWPKSFDEVVLVVSENCEMSDYVMYSLGFKPYEDMVDILMSTMTGEKVETDAASRWTYDEILDTEFRLIMPFDKYEKQTDGTYVDLSVAEAGLSYLYDSDDRSMDIKIVGIIKPAEDSSSTLTGAIAYTSALTDYVVEQSKESEIIASQLNSVDTDVISGLPFKPAVIEELSSGEKAEHIKDYFESLSIKEKAEIYLEILCTPDEAYIKAALDSYTSQFTRDELEKLIIESYAAQMGSADTTSAEKYISEMTDEEFFAFFEENARQTIVDGYAAEAEKAFEGVSDGQIIAMFDSTPHTDEQYADYYELYMPDEYSSSTYEDNLKLLGHVDEESPTSINIYVSTFNDKDEVSELITAYNNGVEEEDRIKYTDYFAIMMSSISTVINAISYVLVAFVAISLVVSSIMIGIITYISVLERTKEIGILRAIGASKRDVSRVFNAETLTVGFVAGLIGILVSLLLIIPINMIIHYLTGISTLSAQLPGVASVVLVCISMALTFIAGLIPSGIAAKKDPVEALRSE